MNRPIKFRAWDKTEKQMGYLDYIWNSHWYKTSNLNNAHIAWENNNKTMKGDRFALMQFTGLTDKKGKEIYEGDIVKIMTTFNEVQKPVIWDLDCWTLSDDGTFGGLAEWNEFAEVIGNIYENPELLDNKLKNQR